MEAGKTGTTRLQGLFRLMRTQLATLLTLLALAAIGYWGWRTEWRIPKFGAAEESPPAAGNSGSATQPEQAATKIVPPQSANKNCPLDQTRIEFPSAESIRLAGIEVVPVEEKPLAATLSAPGEVDYDPTHVARLSTPVPGRVWQVEKEVGERVRKGDILALLDAVKVGEAKAEFLQSMTQVDLKSTTLEKLRNSGDAVAQRLVTEAEAALRDARIRLFNAEQALVNLQLPIRGKDVANLSDEELAARVRFLGLPEAVTSTLNPETATSNLLPITSPLDGIVVERLVAPGEVVDSTKTLFVVADLSRVWVIVNIRQEDRDSLALGQSAAFEPDGHPGETVQGDISWISTIVDEKTRQMRARVVVDNPKEHLPAGTFGTAKITIRDAPQAVVVPTVAVQRDDECRMVFVKVTDQVFQVRSVRPGISSGSVVEILDGLRPGESVAGTGSFTLKSELLKGRLGEHAD